MYIVRWLLGNPIVATWVALAFGIVATLLIFGSGNGNKEDTLNSDVATVSSLEDVKAVVDSNDDKVPSSTIIEEEAVNVVASDEIKKSSDTDTPITTESVVPPLESELSKAPTSVVSTSSKGTATTDLSQATNEEMLLMAREAYWNNGLDEAAQIYNKLIENEPKVLEHKGELGNVYWRQGYPEKAAELYSEIAIPMIESGGTERVANMIGFIGLFYPDRAAEIHKKMQSKK